MFSNRPEASPTIDQNHGTCIPWTSRLPATCYRFHARARKSLSVARAVEQWQESHISILLDASGTTRKRLELERLKRGTAVLERAFGQELSGSSGLDLLLDVVHIRGRCTSRDQGERLFKRINEEVRMWRVGVSRYEKVQHDV